MRTIYKYKLEITGEQTLQIPLDGRMLSVQIQFEEPFLWAEVETEAPMKNVKIHCFGTGEPLPTYAKKLSYIGTVQMRKGTKVFHFFWEFSK